MKTNLKSARKTRGLTQGDIAQSLHVSIQTVFKWEEGLAPVAIRHWIKLASVLHVSEEEIEEILMQTIVDGCIARHDVKAILNAQTSKLYKNELIWRALEQFYASEGQQPQDRPTISEMERVQFERTILERDKRIFELEKQVEELRRELERRRPAASISSALSHNQSANAVERTKQVEEFSSEVNHE